MSDFVIWNPRRGSSGDDLYNIAGGTLLDGSVDSGNPPTFILRGNFLPYDVNPTVAELQAADSLGVNQILGVVNHFSALAGLSALPYRGAGDQIQWAFLVSIKNKIDALRSANGMSAYSWPAIWTGLISDMIGQKILGQHYAELRRAVAITVSQQAWDALGIGIAQQQYTKSGSVWVPGTFTGSISGQSGQVGIRDGNGVTIPGLVSRKCFQTQDVSSLQAGKSLYFTLVANVAGVTPVGSSPPISSFTFSLGYKSPRFTTIAALSDLSGGTALLTGAVPSAATFGPYLITNNMVLASSYTVYLAFDGDVAFQNSLPFTSTIDWSFGQSSTAVNGYFTYQ